MSQNPTQRYQRPIRTTGPVVPYQRRGLAWRIGAHVEHGLSAFADISSAVSAFAVLGILAWIANH